MLQGGGGKVCDDERGMFASVDDLVAHHIQTMEARQLHAPALGPVSEDQANSPLHAPSSRDDRRRTHHVLSQSVVTISLVSDLGLLKKYDIEAVDMYLPDGL